MLVHYHTPSTDFNLKPQQLLIPLSYRSISNIERSIGIKLFAQTQISEIKNPILGSSSMILCVLTEILQLLECATPKHLPQKQKQPVDRPLLVSQDRFCTVLLLAVLASGKHRVLPHIRCPVMHHPSVLSNVSPHLHKLILQIVLNLVLPLASLALHVTFDGEDIM